MGEIGLRYLVDFSTHAFDFALLEAKMNIVFFKCARQLCAWGMN
jgi:hypothetical protein